jgi:hypothetical protein
VLKAYRDGLAIADRLAKADPGNAGWQRDLSVSYNKVGDVLVDQCTIAAVIRLRPEARKLWFSNVRSRISPADGWRLAARGLEERLCYGWRSRWNNGPAVPFFQARRLMPFRLQL